MPDKEPMRFTIEEIKTYILSQDSMGDILYNLSEQNIILANSIKEDDEDGKDEDY